GPQIVVIFELGPPIRVFDGNGRAARYKDGFVAGVDDGFTVTEHDGFQMGIQLDLTPVGARRIFGLPMSELSRRVVPFGDVVRREAGLTQRLAELADWDARFDLLEQVFCRRLAAASGSPIVDWAVGRIEAAGGAVGIADLADDLGYSQK